MTTIPIESSADEHAGAAPAGWVRLRQVIMATDDLHLDSAALRDALGLAPGFPDPVLETIGMRDESIPVGAAHAGPAGGGAFLELVGPLTPEAPINRWLAKVGGRGGYALSLQVPEIPARLEAAGALGVGVIADLEVYGHRIVQFRPADLGLLVEIDEIADPDRWFWDDVEMTQPEDSVVDDVLGVEISCADLAAATPRFSAVLGLNPQLSEDATTFALGARYLRLVAAAEGEHPGLRGVELSVRPGQTAPEGPLLLAGLAVTLR